MCNSKLPNDTKVSTHKVIEEFTPETMELIKKINADFPEDIEMVISKNKDGFYYNLGFGDHKPEEIALFLKQLCDAGIDVIIHALLLQLSNSVGTDFFEKIVTHYNKLVAKSQKSENDQLIMRPFQVFYNGPNR